MTWYKASDSAIRDKGDTVRIQRIAKGWYQVFRQKRGEWVMVREVIGEDEWAKREAKGE